MSRARSSLGSSGFSNLDLIDHVSLLFQCPSHIIAGVAVLSRSDRISKSWRFVIIAQIVRAVLLANAIATSMRGLRSSVCSSQEPLGGPFLIAHRMRVMAPMIGNRRISRCPIFDVPSICDASGLLVRNQP